MDRVLNGDRRALSRLITVIEDDGREAHEALAALHPHTGSAHVVGVTGPPGTGKSTLVNALAKVYRKRGKSVGVVAVDPTSPFSGGALLGDRIRMQELTLDPEVFIRSMATRGGLGGLARATGDAVKALDAFGKDVVIVETVGAGQSEVEVAKNAYTTVVVLAPGLGDDIQAIKAGILEIADVFVVNKADREGADAVVVNLSSMLQMNESREEGWKPPVLRTVAPSGEGVEAVLDTIEEHRAYLAQTGQRDQRRQQWAKGELLALAQQELMDDLLQRVGEDRIEALVERIAERDLDPYTAVKALLGNEG